MTGSGCRGCASTPPSASEGRTSARRRGRSTSRTAAASPGAPSDASARVRSRQISPRRARGRSSTTTSSRRSRNMSAALDRLKQQNAQSGSQQQLDSPETMEALTSILAAVEAQNARLDRLAEQQKKLAGFVKVMDEETTRRLERITAPASTSSPSSDVSARIASIESRQNEIASTLGEVAPSRNGESLNDASQSWVAEAQRNHVATASAIEGLKAQAAANQKLVRQVGWAVQRIEKHTEERVQKAVEQVTGEASTTMTANLDASNERAERIIAATAELEARQLWSAAAAMCLALLPVVVVIAGLWMGIAGLITGAQWALDVDGSVWLGIGRWLVIAVGLAAAGYGVFASVRWVVGLVETWKGRGMPTWPSWRRRSP